jgi:hypothetical protein
MLNQTLELPFVYKFISLNLKRCWWVEQENGRSSNRMNEWTAFCVNTTENKTLELYFFMCIVQTGFSPNKSKWYNVNQIHGQNWLNANNFYLFTLNIFTSSSNYNEFWQYKQLNCMSILQKPKKNILTNSIKNIGNYKWNLKIKFENEFCFFSPAAVVCFQCKYWFVLKCEDICLFFTFVFFVFVEYL